MADEPEMITPEYLEATRLKHEAETRNPRTVRTPIPIYTTRGGGSYIGSGKEELAHIAQVRVVEDEVEE